MPQPHKTMAGGTLDESQPKAVATASACVQLVKFHRRINSSYVCCAILLQMRADFSTVQQEKHAYSSGAERPRSLWRLRKTETTLGNDRLNRRNAKDTSPRLETTRGVRWKPLSENRMILVILVLIIQNEMKRHLFGHCSKEYVLRIPTTYWFSSPSASRRGSWT